VRQHIPDSLSIVIAVSVAIAAVLCYAQWRGDRLSGRRHTAWSVVENLICQFLMAGMILSATLQIVVRYGLSAHITLAWTEEFARLLLVWSGLFGAAMVQRTGDHISMTVVYDTFPISVQQAIRVLGDIVTLTILALLAWYGSAMAYALLQLNTITLGLPLATFAAAVPVTAFFMAVQTIRLLIRSLASPSRRSAADSES
jgi:TRAP-type C4-dicarboxylate transport system permease small subunit